MKRLLLALIPVQFVVGCKDGPTKGDPDAETPPDVTHVRRIGAAGGELGACTECGAPTTGEVCAFCRLRNQVSGVERVPVELVLGKRARAAYLAERSAVGR